MTSRGFQGPKSQVGKPALARCKAAMWNFPLASKMSLTRTQKKFSHASHSFLCSLAAFISFCSIIIKILIINLIHSYTFGLFAVSSSDLFHVVPPTIDCLHRENKQYF